MKRATAQSAFWLLLLMTIAWGIRAPFLQRVQWNLDEGSTFTMAQQVRDGAVLYRDAADNRAPLVPYLKAAVFALCGDWNAQAVHVLLALCLGVAAFLLADLCRQLNSLSAGITAAITFTVLALIFAGPGDSLAAHTEWFVIIFSTVGFWSFVRVLRHGRFVAGCGVGAVFALSTLCKQPGVLDFGVTWIVIAVLALRDPMERPRLARLWAGSVSGFALIGALTVLYFWQAGALADFLYYGWTYNATMYVPAVPLWERFQAARLVARLGIDHAPALGLLAVGGLVLAIRDVARSFRRDKQDIPVLAWLILGWTAAGFVSTTLSGREFAHYAIQLIPGLSLASAGMIVRVFKFARGSTFPVWLRTAVAVAALAAAGWTTFDFVRGWKSINPHEDAQEARLFSLVAAHSTPNDHIFVWGYYPNVYLMAQRRPSSRFIYTNYVTGLIPWTNLDPLIDTNDSVVPHAWDQLMRDLERQPPTLILDTGATRGYLKYPINAQPRLWELIARSYAQVSVNDPDAMGERLFRRVSAESSTVTLPAEIDGAIALSGYSSYRRNESPRIHVLAPSGSARVELFAGDQRIATIDHPVERAIDVLFSAPAPIPPGAVFRAVCTNRKGRFVSAPFDFDGFVQEASAATVSGPRLRLASGETAPASIDSPRGLIERSAPQTWRIFAPAELDYDCAADVKRVSFVHQLVEPLQMLSDGYDLQVSWSESPGSTTQLLLQRLKPRDSGRDQLPQYVRLSLPTGHQKGRLHIKYLAGAANNPDADRIDMSDIASKDNGPSLRLGNQETFAIVAESSGSEAMSQSADGHWAANTPARVEWIRPSTLSSMHFEYGLVDGAFTAKEGHSDGADFSLSIVDVNGREQVLFSKLLTPYNHPEHRGPQVADVVIPSDLQGRLILKIGPGPQNDITWDWAWIGGIVCTESSHSTPKSSHPAP